MDIHFRRLEALDNTDSFDCGQPHLNEFIRKYARQDQRRMLGVTYVAVCCNDPNRVIGYYTLANTSVPRHGLPHEILKGMPKYQSLPAILLGRLAIDRHHQKKRLGELLLSRCFENCLLLAQVSGARYLIADVKESAVTWYERYNFRKIAGNPNPDSTKMFVDLKVVSASIDHKAAASAQAS
jgi:GNAT superfamily N-acetyltransferase